ncbi:putative transcriptional regulator [Hymenobacter luteus]|uniref:Transcriptional regulator n=2 Tax=Hymenobacter TaxID=89966 RepID=A0ABR6K1P8_9BACT|nr:MULTISPECIES: CBS domain-containing protein [Hymenobacter]MBB4602443.1 putative transcriptional regulator [Hymenobacter latericoloratus]MBB6060334.1 putative transcriptional regulator [Hymenobacter luteus]
MNSIIAEDLLNQMIPPLKVTDSMEKAARWLEEFHVSQLPVLDQRSYRGLITEADLLDQDASTRLLGEVTLNYGNVHVQRDQHFYNIIELAVQNKVQLVPVLDDQREYLGVVTVSDTLAAFGKVPVASSQQGIIVLAMEERDYSLTQISRYVEENNAKVISAHVAQDEHDPYRIRLTLKLNTPNIARIIATLERFNYSITAQFSGTEEVSEDEQQRYDALLRYLNI